MKKRNSALLLVLALMGCERASGTKQAVPSPGASRPVQKTASAVSGRRVLSLALGWQHACALISDGTVRCWGLSENGELGTGRTATIGDDEPAALGAAVALGGTAVAISAGDNHTCALLDTGAVRCWGKNDKGQLGYGNTLSVGDDETPASVGDVPLSKKVKAVAAGSDHTCVLLTENGIRCWGDNSQQGLGYAHVWGNVGDDEAVETVPEVVLPRQAKELGGFVGGACVLYTDGGVHCWGTLIGGEDDPMIVGKSRDVDIGVKAAALSLASNGLGCVITSSGGARCWGADSARAYPEASLVDIHEEWGESKAPSQLGDMPLPPNVRSVQLSGDFGCYLLADGEVRCWGYDGSGFMGDPSTLKSSSLNSDGAITIDIGEPSLSLAMSEHFACVITQSGAVRCWGSGKNGQLGYGSTEDVGGKRTPREMGDVPLGL